MPKDNKVSTDRNPNEEITDIQCSRCGTLENLDSKSVACTATSYWQKDSKPSMIPVLHRDDIKIWELSLCDNCISAGYADHLKQQMRKYGKDVLNTIMGMVLGPAALILLFWILQDEGESGNILILLYVNWKIAPIAWIICLILVVGPFLILSSLFKRHRFSRAYKQVARSNEVPKTAINDAFLGEANRIIELQRKEKNKKTKSKKAETPQSSLTTFYGKYELPVEKTKTGMYMRQNLVVEAEKVASSKEEVIAALPEGWKKALNKKS